MVNKIEKKGLGVLILATLGGIFYRMGGSGNFPRWTRLVGQGICVVGSMFWLGLVQGNWKSILGVFLMFGATFAESTYWKKKGTDAKWYNWALVGLVFGLIPLPWCWLTDSHWLGFGIRIPICVGSTVLWQEKVSAIVEVWFRKTFGKDILDEFGRGLINIVTFPLLLL